MLTRRKVVDYMRSRRGAALAQGAYQIEVVEGRSSELVTPEEPDGIRLDIPPRSTLWGRIDFALYVAPRPDRRRHVAVVGAGATTIVDDLAEIEEFADDPWSSDEVSGMIVFDGLRQTAGRRAVLRDREAFPVFVDAVRSVEPAVRRTLERVHREVDEATVDRLADAVQRIFRKVLKELEDVDNPMRSWIGPVPGEGGLFSEEGEGVHEDGEPREPGELDDALPPSDPEPISDRPPEGASPDRARSRSLPTLAPDPNPDGTRSRYDPDDRIVYFNDGHADYLLAKEDEGALLEYLSTLVAKELVVYNNPRSAPGELGEEIVRMLVRVRRHIPRRRR